MSKVHLCSCGARTTEPYMVNGVLMCGMCAEEAFPQAMRRRVREQERQYIDHAKHDHQMRRWN